MIKITNKVLLFFILTTNTLATTYCFNRNQPLRIVKSRIKPVLLADEGIVLDEARGCVEIAVRPYRENLIATLINSNFKGAKANYISDVGNGSLCKIKIKKVLKKQREEFSAEVGTKNNILKNKNEQNSVTTSDIIVTSGKSAEIEFDDINLRVKCIKIGNFFDLNFSLKGGVSGISSSIRLVENQWMNIGNIQKKFNEESNSKSVRRGIKHSRQEGLENNNYSLMVY